MKLVFALGLVFMSSLSFAAELSCQLVTNAERFDLAYQTSSKPGDVTPLLSVAEPSGYKCLAQVDNDASGNSQHLFVQLQLPDGSRISSGDWSQSQIIAHASADGSQQTTCSCQIK